jgi:hypothetical protein
MPSYDIETIDGIPVVLRDGVMFAFIPPTGAPSAATPAAPQTPIRLGTYDAKTKKATWEMTPQVLAWKNAFASAIASRARQTAAKPTVGSG